MLEEANERMEDMQQQQGHEKCLAEIKQLKTYNHELEEQFNSQMEIITALKKKFILVLRRFCQQILSANLAARKGKLNR